MCCEFLNYYSDLTKFIEVQIYKMGDLNINVIGTNEQYLTFNKLKLVSGHFLEEKDIEKKLYELKKWLQQFM